jgi:dTDP-3-amino-3,4,6-trideoxy-alpha-D-glucopyranose N,N-dimethyltransferase
MFAKSQQFYDAVYSFKDYTAEAESIVQVIRKAAPEAQTLLDVACGTGMHLADFVRHFDCEGIDLDEEMVVLAKARVPEATLHQGNMVEFDLGKRFDVVVCLFSSIGYADTLADMRKACKCFAAHLNKGGLLVVEPWITPENFADQKLGSIFVDRHDLKLARIHVSRRSGNKSVIDFHYLVGTLDGVDHFEERHVMGLYTDEEYQEAFVDAGFAVSKDPEGPMGRGLWIGKLLG